MLIFDFYIYIFLVFVWIAYLVNSFYQNHRMKHHLPNRKKEILTIPFYIFAFWSFYVLEEKLIPIFSNGQLKNINGASGFGLFAGEPAYITLVKVAGIIFCIISILLYTYISFFEKSFPSCLAIENGKQLKGIYNYIRHPSYYIFLFLTFGISFCLLNVPLFILACINHMCLYFYYMIEENEIKKTSPYYNEYFKKTKRFFPTFSKLYN